MYVSDSYGDGMKSGYLSVGKRNRNNPNNFDTFADLALNDNFGTSVGLGFTVQEDWVTSTGGGNSNAPWGCNRCPCCETKCAQRRAYNGDPAKIKECAADLCHTYYGKGNCGTVVSTTSFNPLDGCSNCRCCKDKCNAKYTGDDRKPCKDNFCRAHFGKAECVDGTTPNAGPFVSYDTSVLIGCRNCRCCKDNCNGKYTGDDRKSCKDDVCRAYYGINECVDGITPNRTPSSTFDPLRGCSNCRCCKDNCADEYDDQDEKKACKSSICRAHFGKDTCNDSNNIYSINPVTTFDPLRGCSNCRCCKDKCEDKYTGDARKDCKTNICRAHYGKDPCVDGNNGYSINPVTTFDPLRGCSNCRCCKDKCEDKYTGDDARKDCKTNICRA